MQRIFLFLACFFICADNLAQQYPFVIYTPKNGLVNSRVRKMYQDSRGRLYFLTFGGLSVYDGARFRNYTTYNGLASDMVNDVIEVGEDSFFVAPNTNKMNMLVNGQVKDFEPAGSFCPIINQFLKSDDGNIYVTTDQGLFVLKGKKFEHLSFDLPGGPAIPPFLGTIVELGDMFLISTNDLRHFKGLYLYDKKNRKLSDAMPDVSVNSLGKDKSSRIWISIRDKIHTLDTAAIKNGKLQLRPIPASYQSATGFAAASFAFDSSNTWIIHSGKEIVKAGNDNSLLRIRIPDEEGQGNSGRIFIDRENILWICSMGAGAFKLVSTDLQINEAMPGTTETDFISNISYLPDTTWYVVNSDHLIRKTASGIHSFFVSNTDRLYGVWQLDHRLVFFDKENMYTASVPTDTEKKISIQQKLGLPDSSFGGLAAIDRYGNFIVTEANHVTAVQNNRILSRHQLHESDIAQSLQFDDQHRLWVASRYAGLLVFTLHPEDPSHYLQLAHDFREQLAGISPRCMILDKKGIIWVGTRHNGLLAFTYENGQLKKLLHFQTRQGLTDNFITSLSRDSADNIIAGTQTGLDRLVATGKYEYRIENITKSSAIFGYINIVWVDHQNETYALFNGNSILKVMPITASQMKYEPRLFIEEIKVNGAAINPAIQNIQLRYMQRNISFSVAAPAFVDEQQVQYSYLLEGSGNHEWSEASTNASINFLNLPPGHYTLQVKASFPSTTYQPQQLSYPFTIVPPWWQTIWFRVMAGILIIVIIILVIRFYYIQKLEKQKTVLERQQAVEKERTRIATDMHDDLGAGLSRIKFLSETIGIKKQQQLPIEEDITKIREYSHDMIDKMGEIVWALNKDNDTLSDLLSYTRAYSVEYLSQNGIQCVFEAPEQFPSIILSGDFRRDIYLAVKEALHNIVKHSQASRVDIHITTGNNLMISIQDNGIGFDEKKLRPFSNGLNNMKKRMMSLGGKLKIKSEEGTTVIMNVPLP